jgi:hypothetical protein
MTQSLFTGLVPQEVIRRCEEQTANGKKAVTVYLKEGVKHPTVRAKKLIDSQRNRDIANGLIEQNEQGIVIVSKIWQTEGKYAW